MLKIRSVCENCNKELPNESTEAMICSFECTFCQQCVESILQNVCPNCGGGFEKRPIRPKQKLLKYPNQAERYHRPVDLDGFEKLLLRYKDIEPNER